MPREIDLNDGRTVVAPGEMTPEQLDAFADIAEGGGQLPPGFAIRGPGLDPGTGYGPPEAVPSEPGAWDLYKGVANFVTGNVTGTMRNPQGEVISRPGQEPTDLPVQEFARQLAVARGTSLAHADDQLLEQINQNLDTARFVGEVLVPQNLADAASLAVLLPLAPVAGVTGAALRTAAPVLADVVARAAAGQPQDLLAATVKGIGSLTGEAVSGAVRWLKTPAFLKAAKVKLGNDLVEQTGEVLSQQTSFQAVKKPADLARLVDSEKGYRFTSGYKTAQAKMHQSQEGLMRNAEMAARELSPSQRAVVDDVLDAAAGINLPDPITGAAATPLSSLSVSKRLEMAIESARTLGETVRGTKGMDKLRAMRAYNDQLSKIKGAMDQITPDGYLTSTYEAMNNQFRKDAEFVQWLWRHKKKMFTADQTGTHLNAPEFQNAARSAAADFEAIGMKEIAEQIAPRGGAFGAQDVSITPGITAGVGPLHARVGLPPALRPVLPAGPEPPPGTLHRLSFNAISQRAAELVGEQLRGIPPMREQEP